MEFATRDDWRGWLDGHHATSRGVLLLLARKGVGRPSVSYAEALEVALCYGWIDGQKRVTTTRLAPEVHAAGRQERLVEGQPRKGRGAHRQRRMRPAGLAEVEAAKADGRWGNAYDAQGTAVVPADLQAALEARPEA